MLSGKQERILAINISDKQHKRLEETLGEIAEAYKNGSVSRAALVGALAQIISAAMIDNKGEVESWLTPETLETWKEDAVADRT